MSDNVKSSNQNITLYENGKLLNDPIDVCTTFNEYYINITKDMAESDGVREMSVPEVIEHYKDHHSIKLIHEHVAQTDQFDFTHINQHDTFKKLLKIQMNKATGFDNISPKFLKVGANQLCYSMTPIINNCLSASIYPDLTKRAEVTPLYKKSDRLSKENYRPLSILTSTSKIFERILCDQIHDYIDNILSPDLSAYRKSYSCNNVLVKCIEDWRKALDNDEKVGCIMIDLSKAFDCLPHGLLIAKLHAYGISSKACELILHYLKNRKQTVKIGNLRSEWLNLKTGVPQGSIFGPLLFNIFINDFLFDLKNSCQVYNYADDNTLSFQHKDISIIKQTLEDASEKAIQWFSNNFMKANPSKFQAICICKDNKTIDFSIDDNIIKSEPNVKLLGINIDAKLNFKNHVSTISKKAGKQINALLRISKQLNYESKLRIFEAFIASNFVYCRNAYDTFTIGQDRKLEKLNERAIRLVCNDFTSPYQELLDKTGKRMLYVTRKTGLIIFVYKVLHNLAPPVSNTFFKMQDTPYNMRDNHKLIKPVFKTIQYGKRSIAYQGAHLWNMLPSYIKNIDELSEFSNCLRAERHVLTCECGNCILCLRNNL